MCIIPEKITTKKTEQDQWFEEKFADVLNLQVHLKHLYNQFNSLFTQRKEAGHALKQYSITLNHLATVEEHISLSSALIELANLQEKLDILLDHQACYASRHHTSIHNQESFGYQIPANKRHSQDKGHGQVCAGERICRYRLRL